MNKLLYIIVIAFGILSMTSCSQDEDLTNTTTEIEQIAEESETNSVNNTEVTLRINGQEVITSNAKGSFCDEFEQDTNSIYAGITNSGYYISELSELDSMDLEVGQYILLHVEFSDLEENDNMSVGVLMARVDLGNGPVYVVSDFDFAGSSIQFDQLSPSLIEGAFSGNIFLVEENVDVLFHNENLGNFELSFRTTDIEICPE